jgi:hypothetical protein
MQKTITYLDKIKINKILEFFLFKDSTSLFYDIGLWEVENIGVLLTNTDYYIAWPGNSYSKIQIIWWKQRLKTNGVPLRIQLVYYTHDNGYDGYGCNDSICIPECKFYPEGNIA